MLQGFFTLGVNFEGKGVGGGRSSREKVWKDRKVGGPSNHRGEGAIEMRLGTWRNRNDRDEKERKDRGGEP